MSWPEFEAQAEGCEQLELLWELERAAGALRPVALPALEALPVVVAAGVAIIVHHVQHVVFHALGWFWDLVVRTVDVQVVIDGHLHSVVAMEKPVEKENRVFKWK